MSYSRQRKQLWQIMSILPCVMPLFIYCYADISAINCKGPCSLQWSHNKHDGVSNHQPDDCLPNRLSRRRSKKTSKLLVTGLCVGNSPMTREFPSQRASNAENVSIWWRHHVQSVQVYARFTGNTDRQVIQHCFPLEVSLHWRIIYH